jgi:hypothetical protein
MDVNEKEAFKLGFLYRCAEESLTGADLDGRIKSAADLCKAGFIDFGVLSNALNATKGIAAAPIMLGTVAGGLGGHLAAKLTEPDVDEDDLKAKELAAAYKAYAARAKTNRKLRLYRPER